MWICTRIKLCSLTMFYISLISNLYSGNRGGRCREGLEDHHIQTGRCNSIEEKLIWCIRGFESKQRRMPTFCLSWVPLETFKSTEEITGWCPNWRWIDQVLSPWVVQSTDTCWHLVVYQRSFGRSTVVRSCKGLCSLWEDV